MRTSYILSIPFGITYLGAVLLENNYKVRLFDVFPNDNLNEIVDELSNTFKPDLIGFSVLTTNFHTIKSFAHILRKRFPNTIFCAGGIHPTVRTVDTIEQMNLDFVVIGEGEKIIVKVCNAIENNKSLHDIKGIAFKEGESFHINKELDIVEDLDSLPFPARDLLNVSKYLVPPGYIRFQFLNRVMSVLTSRGCPGNCTFCNSYEIFHKRIRRRSVNNVIKEILFLIDNYNVDGIYFHDETFTMKSEWVKYLCERIKHLGIPWGCQTRVGFVNDELLRIMKDSGCIQIDFGLESASKKVLKSIKKEHTPEQMKLALDLTKKHKIKTFGSFMIGLPGETEEDIKETYNFLKTTKPDFTYFNLFTPFPGTEAAETAIKEGKLEEDYFNRDYDMLLETVPLVNISSMSMDTIVHYHRKLRNMVFLKNYSGVLNIKNLIFILEAIVIYLISPHVLINSIKELIKTRNVEKFVFMIFSNYQRWYTKKNNKVIKNK